MTYEDKNLASVRISHATLDTHGLNLSDKKGLVQVSVKKKNLALCIKPCESLAFYLQKYVINA